MPARSRIEVCRAAVFPKICEKRRTDTGEISKITQKRDGRLNSDMYISTDRTPKRLPMTQREKGGNPRSADAPTEPMSPERPEIWEDGAVEVDLKLQYRRFTLKNIAADLLDAFLLHKGVLFTLKELMIRPDQVVRGFIDTKRLKYTHPLKLFLLTAGVYLFIILQLNLYGAAISANVPDAEGSEVVVNLMQKYFLNYLNAWMGVSAFFYALTNLWIFRKSGFNYAEHLILTIYLSAAVTAVYIVLALLSGVIPEGPRLTAETVILLVYFTWAVKRTLRYTWGAAVWRSLVSLLLGSVLFYTFILIFFTALGIVHGVGG